MSSCKHAACVGLSVLLVFCAMCTVAVEQSAIVDAPPTPQQDNNETLAAAVPCFNASNGLPCPKENGSDTTLLETDPARNHEQDIPDSDRVSSTLNVARQGKAVVPLA